MTNKYVSEFLSLRCSGDILNVVNPIGNKAQKEITESMAIVKEVKKIALKHPMEYTLYDFCAGNALTSIISVFVLPIKEAIAIDKLSRKRNWHLAKRFSYIFKDINKFDISKIGEKSIIIGVHACTNLSKRIIEIYLQSKAEYLILMPCCIGQFQSRSPSYIGEKIGKYIEWVWYLSEMCNGKFKVDSDIISPKNGIIVAKKEDK
uniref:Putative methyltransferase n=1 Tax=viral metagenome TaxID=1070528 RepID=A0A6M3JWX7_9ZZZZ